MTIELTHAEHEFLVTVLEERQHELLHEISKADAHDFRRSLREKEVVLETLLGKLTSEKVSTAV